MELLITIDLDSNDEDIELVSSMADDRGIARLLHTIAETIETDEFGQFNGQVFNGGAKFRDLNGNTVCTVAIEENE